MSPQCLEIFVHRRGFPTTCPRGAEWNGVISAAASVSLDSGQLRLCWEAVLDSTIPEDTVPAPCGRVVVGSPTTVCVGWRGIALCLGNVLNAAASFKPKSSHLHGVSSPIAGSHYVLAILQQTKQQTTTARDLPGDCVKTGGQRVGGRAGYPLGSAGFQVSQMY